MLRSSKILLADFLLEASLWRYKSKFFYLFADIFQEALWRLGNRLVSMGKATGGIGFGNLDGGSCTAVAARFLW